MKKLVALLCMFTCIFSLTACAKGDTTDYKSNYDEAALRESTEYIVTQLESMDDAQLEEIVNMKNEKIASDVEVAKSIKASYKSWLDSKEELGAYAPEDSDTFLLEADADGATATLTATFANRQARVIVHYTDESQLDTFKFEPIYSTGESMANAGLNTVLGMGTVFVVLIFISFLISLFKYINKAETYFAQRKDRKNAMKQEDTFVPVDPANAPAVLEEVSDEVDDLELVAVITAAVAASMNTSVDQLVVRSIKRKSTNKWQKA